MKKILVMLTAIFFSLSTWGQQKIPIFSLTNELFRLNVSQADEAVPILKKYGLATDDSWETKRSPYSNTGTVLENVIYAYGGQDGTILIEITYDWAKHKNNYYAVSFNIMGYDYYSTFLSYLKKNGYTFIGEGDKFPWARYYKNGKYVCKLTKFTDDSFNATFVFG